MHRFRLPLLLCCLSLALHAELEAVVVAEVEGRLITLGDIDPPERFKAHLAATHPQDEVALQILGMRAARLSQLILPGMAEAYLGHQNMEPDRKELSDLAETLQDLDRLDRDLTEWWRTWKFNQMLYREFGGRLEVREFGLEAVEAFGQYLELQEKAGGFVIHQPVLHHAFYYYFTNQTGHVWFDGDVDPWMHSAAEAARLAGSIKQR